MLHYDISTTSLTEDCSSPSSLDIDCSLPQQVPELHAVPEAPARPHRQVQLSLALPLPPGQTGPGQSAQQRRDVRQLRQLVLQQLQQQQQQQQQQEAQPQGRPQAPEDQRGEAEQWSWNCGELELAECDLTNCQSPPQSALMIIVIAVITPSLC